MSRPTLPWRSPLVYLPNTASEVWIRRLPWYDSPVLAHLSDETAFTLTVPTADPENPEFSVSVPLALVHTWKFRYLADEQAAFPPEE